MLASSMFPHSNLIKKKKLFPFLSYLLLLLSHEIFLFHYLFLKKERANFN